MQAPRVNLDAGWDDFHRGERAQLYRSALPPTTFVLGAGHQGMPVSACFVVNRVAQPGNITPRLRRNSPRLRRNSPRLRSQIPRLNLTIPRPISHPRPGSGVPTSRLRQCDRCVLAHAPRQGQAAHGMPRQSRPASGALCRPHRRPGAADLRGLGSDRPRDSGSMRTARPPAVPVREWCRVARQGNVPRCRRASGPRNRPIADPFREGRLLVPTSSQAGMPRRARSSRQVRDCPAWSAAPAATIGRGRRGSRSPGME